ncbi:MAG: hypothetical protein WKF62_09365 [Solirubrobacterales bacterium]
MARKSRYGRLGRRDLVSPLRKPQTLLVQRTTAAERLFMPVLCD